MFRRPTKELEDGIASGRNAILGLPGATPVEGGLPIVAGGKIIGGIRVSGVTSSQDGQVARAEVGSGEVGSRIPHAQARLE
jgi:uncharacterized protein GlcG (DUF336 family)